MHINEIRTAKCFLLLWVLWCKENCSWISEETFNIISCSILKKNKEANFLLLGLLENVEICINFAKLYVTSFP